MNDQERWYREQMGDAAAERQIQAANKQRGKCTCGTPTSERAMKRKWDGERLTVRTIHLTSCPKWKTWMSLV